MSVKMRQMVEKEICTAVVDALLAAGYAISVDNGGDEPEVVSSADRAVILAGMFATDDERLYAEKPAGTHFGWVYFVYGNDGYDVMSDYTVNLESVVGEGTSVDKVIETYAD